MANFLFSFIWCICRPTTKQRRRPWYKTCAHVRHYYMKWIKLFCMVSWDAFALVFCCCCCCNMHIAHGFDRFGSARAHSSAFDCAFNVVSYDQTIQIFCCHNCFFFSLPNHSLSLFLSLHLTLFHSQMSCNNQQLQVWHTSGSCQSIEYVSSFRNTGANRRTRASHI